MTVDEALEVIGLDPDEVHPVVLDLLRQTVATDDDPDDEDAETKAEDDQQA